MTKISTSPEARTRTPSVRARFGAIAVTTAVIAASCAAVVATAPPSSAGPAPVQFGYVPMPADQFQQVMEHLNSAADTTIDFTVGIASAAAGAVITYDQWEDGYETDLANPTQATTQVWGDGNPANGDASTVCSVCTGDLIPQGAVLVGRNSITTPRDASQIRYDGRDEVASTRGFALTVGGFSTPLGSVLAGSVSAFATSTYGTDYVVPVGQNTPTPSGTSPAFEYTGAVVMASEDGTTVNVDLDGDGTVDQTSTINRGEVVFVDGGLDEGAHITTNKPVQVHLATGDVGASYESRWFTLFPTPLLTSDYLSPVGSSVDNQRTIIYLFNPNSSAITITPTCTSCSGTLSVPAHTSTSFATPVGEAVRFASNGAEAFLGVGGSGSQSGAAPGSAGDNSATYDWGFTLIPTRLLTTQAVLGWAPGNSTNPPSAAGAGHDDDDPVWITTLTATTLHVDFDGDPSTGAISSADCFGAKHDADISVGALASTRIIDPSDSDMTGARVYTCDGTKIAGAWGEDPASAPSGSPGFDAGYTLIPSTTMIVDKSSSVFTDANGDGKPSPGDTLTYDVSIADAGSLAFTNVAADDAVPAGTSYVAGSTVFDDGSTITPIADDTVPSSSTVFPLDEGGAALPNITAGVTVHVRYKLAIDNPFDAAGTTVTNTASVTADEASASDTNVVQLTSADLSLTKSQTASPVYVGDNAVFHLTVANAGPDSATGVVVKDLLPGDLTYVSSSPSQGSYAQSTGLWSVGTLASGASATIDITATVDDTSATNFAQVTAVNAADPDSQPAENLLDGTHPPNQDDEASATVTVAQKSADLSLTKTQTASPVYVGDDAVFHLTVANAGPDAATGVVVTDLLPADLTYAANSPSQGTYTHANGLWSVGTLASGESATLDITARVDATSATNFAQVSASDAADPDSQPAENPLDATHPPDQDDEASATVTVASITAGALGDTVWLDRDGNGKRAAGEPGIKGVKVWVRWAGPDGTFGTGDDVVKTDTTDANGSWHVGGLSAGHYRVAVDATTLPFGPRTSPTYDLDGTASPNRADLTLTTNQVRTDVDFGYRGAASVGDTVFDDANGNGKVDPGEGMSGVTVTVTAAGPDGKLGTSGDVDHSVTTNAEGVWSVGGLPPGPIRVRVSRASMPSSLINTVDPDGGSDGDSLVTLVAGTSNLEQDFGYSMPVTFGDHVWLDLNGNGVIDAGESGVAGVTITLLRDADGDGVYETTVATATTDASGDYLFDSLPSGKYRALIDSSTAPGGSALTTPGHVDADLAPGQSADTGNFGLVVPTLPRTGGNLQWPTAIALLLIALGGWWSSAGRRRRSARPPA